MISNQNISFNRITIINDSSEFGDTVREVISSYSKNIPPVLIEIKLFDENESVKSYVIDKVVMDYPEPPSKGNTLEVSNNIIKILFYNSHDEEIYYFYKIKRITLYYPY